MGLTECIRQHIFRKANRGSGRTRARHQYVPCTLLFRSQRIYYIHCAVHSSLREYAEIMGVMEADLDSEVEEHHICSFRTEKNTWHLGTAKVKSYRQEKETKAVMKDHLVITVRTIIEYCNLKREKLFPNLPGSG